MEPQEIQPESTSTTSETRFSALRTIVSKITVEPIVFLYHVSSGIINIVTQNMIQEKFCEKFYNGTKAKCRDYLTAFNGTLIADRIQQYASDYTLYTNLVTLLPAIILVVLLAQWSDRNGRKLIILLPLVGVTITSICYAVVSVVDSSIPQDILLSMVPGAVSGGTTLFLIGCYSYLSDATKEGERTSRMAIFEGIMISGTPIGTLIGAEIYSNYGYPMVYVTSTALNVLLIIYAGFHVKNIKPDRTESLEEPSKVSCLKQILDNIRVCFKRRAGFLRVFIVLLLLSDALYQLPDTGEDDLLFLYSRKMYNWNTAIFSKYKSYLITMRSLGVILLLPILSQKFRITDSILGLSCGCIRIIDCTMKTFSYVPIILWIDGVLVLFNKFAFVVNRSMLSKCVPPNELGKVFAVDSILTTGSSLVGDVLYTQVYRATVSVFPGSIFLVTIVVILPMTAIFIFIHYTNKKHPIAFKTNSVQ